MANDFQAKLNTVAAALHTMHAMSALYHEEGYEKLIASPDGLKIWESLCEDLMAFLKEVSLPVGSAIILLMTREGKISFTRILSHVKMHDHGDTVATYRQYLRRMVMADNGSNPAKVADLRGHRRYPAEATGLVDETEGKPA